MASIDGRSDGPDTAAQAEEVVEENELTRFEQADEYMELLATLVPSAAASSRSAAQPNAKSPHEALTALSAILDEYQQQSYLLDPYLEQMVGPPIAALQAYVRSSQRYDAGLVVQLSRLIYLYTKIRGYKAITNFFPHQVSDLAPTLTFLERLSRPERFETEGAKDGRQLASCWELRYVLLLWLSLVCMIPFDLNKFDAGKDADEAETSTSSTRSTAHRIELVGRTFISSPGKERDAAAVMFGKLFQRQDVYDAQFEAFAAFCSATLVSNPSAFAATGILQALCEIVKTNDPAFVTSRLPIIQAVLDLYDDPDRRELANNGLVTKYQTKLTCRLGLKLLRPRKRQRFIRVQTLGGSGTDADLASAGGENAEEDEEEDVPELIDSYISKLIDSLQNKDTVVRYSAAKGLARLCERLPKSFISQVTDAIESLFHINVPDLYEGANDLSAVSESTWQGACMALAEQARRGQLFAGELASKLEWIGKALLFDVRRGAHSVGANVRDSACYVIWALARAHDAEVIRPHATVLAQKLVAVATLDRDVSIRRAASAAFQECVGRLNLFPHGIEVIRITDFYAVSVRKNAFLGSAVEAARFDVYREYLLRHLLDVTICHWDVAMRRLGARAVARVVSIDAGKLARPVVSDLRKLCTSQDSAVLHGAILSLSEIAAICASTGGGAELADLCEQFFATVDTLATTRMRRTTSALVLEAACTLIGSSFQFAIVSALPPALPSKHWTKIIYTSLSQPEEFVHDAVAAAVGSASTSGLEWKTFTPAQQQSNALMLGSFDYTRHADRFEIALDHLMAIVDASSLKSPASRYCSHVEARRNAYVAIVKAVTGLGPRLGEVVRPRFFHSLLSTLLHGLEDYTTDQRGDVGSWNRLVCIPGLVALVELLRSPAVSLNDAAEYLTQEMLDAVVAGLLKQSVERIDQLREVAGRNVLRLYRLDDGDTAADRPQPRGDKVVRDAFLIGGTVSPIDFRDAPAFFPRAVRLLLIPSYRQAVLLGLLLSVGSKSELGTRTILSSLVTFLDENSAPSVPTTDEGEGYTYTPLQLLRDLSAHFKANSGNNKLVVPILDTLRAVLEGGIVEPLLEQPDDRTKQEVASVLTTLLRQATASLRTLKSPARLLASMHLVLSLLPLPLPPLRTDALGRIYPFLTHRFPTVRTQTAEVLYTVLSVHDLLDPDDDDEEGGGPVCIGDLLLETRWAEGSVATCEAVAREVVRLLTRRIGVDPSG